MSTIKQPVQAKAALTVASLSTLASANYCVSAVKDNTTNQPVDLLVEFSATPGTVTGNKQAVLFAKSSLDNSEWSTGPETGTTTTDEANLVFIGVLPLATSSTKQTRHFSVASQFGGVLPPYLKFVVKNESGAAFTAGSINVSEINPTVV